MTTFTAVFSLFLALYFVGLLAITGENTRSILQYLRSKYKIEVFFKQDVNYDSAKKISESILNIKGTTGNLLATQRLSMGANFVETEGGSTNESGTSTDSLKGGFLGKIMTAFGRFKDFL